jgi:hypothetical protein
MIDLELGHFIAKFYLLAYFVVFIFSFINAPNNKSNLIIITLALVFCIFNQYLKFTVDFYNYYLTCAAFALLLILISLAAHFYLKIKHPKTTLFVYASYLSIAASYLIMHRVRIVIFDNDDSIMWLINGQSTFTNTFYFLNILVFFYGTKIKWNSYFGRLSS